MPGHGLKEKPNKLKAPYRMPLFLYGVMFFFPFVRRPEGIGGIFKTPIFFVIKV